MLGKLKKYFYTPLSGRISSYDVIRIKRMKEELKPDEKIVVDGSLIYVEKKTKCELIFDRLRGRFMK